MVLCWQAKHLALWHLLLPYFTMYFLKNSVIIIIINIYTTIFYGSNIWSLSSHSSERLYTSWNIMIRRIWNLPNTTHRYLIEEISNSRHIKISIFKRYLKFIDSLKVSQKPCLAALANLVCRDKHSITCQNIEYISKECDLINPVENPGGLNQAKYLEIPQEEVWRVCFLKELLQLQNPSGDLSLPDNFFTKKELKDLITYVATT